jgi:hypothetical protein
VSRRTDTDGRSDQFRVLIEREAPAVLAQALSRAREQAVARLTELIADALVERAAAEYDASVGHEVPSSSCSEPALRGLYAYAITRADLPLPDAVPALTGSGRVHVLREHDLGLLFSDEHLDDLQVDENDLSESGLLARLVRAHDAVVRAAFDVGPVLPLRFGTVVEDERGARQLLTTHAEAARKRLDHVHGCDEWGLRLTRFLEEDRAPRHAVIASPQGDTENAQVRTGTEYLAHRRQALHEADEVSRKVQQAADRVQEELSYAVDFLQRGGSAGSSLLLDVAYLIPRASEPRFRADTDRLATELDQQGLRLEVTGPWPPYSFASLDPGGPDGD